MAKTVQLTTQIGTQPPWSKKVPIYVYLEVPYSAQRAKILITSTPNAKINPQEATIEPVIANKKYQIKATLLPQSKGTYKIDTTVFIYTQTQTIPYNSSAAVNFNSSLRQTPHPKAYYPMAAAFYLTLATIFIGALILFIKLGKKLIYVYIPNWLAKEENKPI